MDAPQVLSEGKGATVHWLTPARLRAYPLILLFVTLAAVLAYVLASEGLEDPLGKPLGTYFSPFRAGAELALQGEAAAVYEPQRLLQAQQAAIPGTDDVFLWPQPPIFLLLVLPLGLLPYLPGLIAWLTLGFGSYALALLRGLEGRAGTWAILAFPGAVFCALNSQTGLLATGLLTAGLLQLTERPARAGLLLGLAGFRPELALLTCIALAAGRCWRALAAALGTLGALVLLSLAGFGPQPWSAWWQSLPWIGQVLAEGNLPWFKLVSFYGAARLPGLGLEAAVVLQLLASAAALAALVWAWRQDGVPAGLKGAVLALAALLVSPLTLAYDLVLLAPALLWLAQDGAGRGWLKGERELLAAGWALPLLGLSLAQLTQLQFAPLIIAALMLLALHRVRGAVRPARDPGAAESGRPATRAAG